MSALFFLIDLNAIDQRACLRLVRVLFESTSRAINLQLKTVVRLFSSFFFVWYSTVIDLGVGAVWGVGLAWNLEFGIRIGRGVQHLHLHLFMFYKIAL